MNRIGKLFTQFSLRFLLVALIPLSVGLGWYGSHYRHHRIEQGFLRDLTASSTTASSCTVESNGAKVSLTSFQVFL